MSATTSRAVWAETAQAGHTAAPIARDFMKLALADKPAIPFKIPAGIKLIRVDAKTGMRAGPGDSGKTILEAFKPGTAPPDNYSVIGVADADEPLAQPCRRTPTATSCVPAPADCTSPEQEAPVRVKKAREPIALCGVRRYIPRTIMPARPCAADQRAHARRSRTPRRRDQAVSRAAEEASLTSMNPRRVSPS